MHNKHTYTHSFIACTASTCTYIHIIYHTHNKHISTRSPPDQKPDGQVKNDSQNQEQSNEAQIQGPVDVKSANLTAVQTHKEGLHAASHSLVPRTQISTSPLHDEIRPWSSGGQLVYVQTQQVGCI